MEETGRKRERFLLEYGHLFEALLPESNYIAKLRAKYAARSEKVEAASANANANANGLLLTPEVKAEAGVEVKAEVEVRGGEDKPAAEAGFGDAEAKPESRTEIQVEDKPEVTTEVGAEVKAAGSEPTAAPPPTELRAVPYKLLEKQPPNVTATMKGYQLSGLSFLVWLYNNGSSGILGDEMGLGKTLQTLSLFSYLTTFHPCPADQQRPFLVVCPLSVVSSWVSECKKWTPHLRVLRLHGPAEERDRLKKVAETGETFGLDADDDANSDRGYDVVITSYEVFEREKQWFRRAFVWRYVVLDEGHKIKNEKTNVASALQGLSAEYRLILTGTPLQNNLTELWALIHWLFPEVFNVNTSKVFSDAFDLTAGKNDLKVMDNARRLLELIMLRRMKESKGVNLGLPKKTEVILYLPLVPMQRFWYKRLLTRLDKGVLEQVFREAKEKAVEEEKEADDHHRGKEGIVADRDLENLGVGDEQWGETRMIVEKAIKEKQGTQWQKLMNLLMQLRKCCSHPYLLPNAEPSPPINGPHVILASSKFILLDKLIDELCLRRGQKVLLFSGFTKMLDICEDLMQLKGGDGTKFKYGRLDGMTARARRNLAIRLFNNDPDYKVMLISTRAGGLGINLASASNVVMLDSDWNPQADLQAQARAHRIGQTQEVTVYRLITQGTVEEQMMGRIRKKLYLSAKVTESMRDIHTSTSSVNAASSAEDNMPNLTTSQLMSLVRSGSRAIAREEIDPTEMLKWDWATTIKKCTEYSQKLQHEETAQEAADNEEEEKRWLSEMEKVETRVFEGKNHVRNTQRDSNHEISAEWTRESRRLGMERVVMVDGHPVLKETIGNNAWEAVATLSGKDPRLAEPPKRKRRAMDHQDYCQICYDGGELTLCSGCPRTYHYGCLTREFQLRSKSKMGQFYCPQHQCADCSQKTTNAGGMLFRCRWCQSAYCEDCIDFDKIDLLGESLVEYENLGLEPSSQAFYIKCESCIEYHAGDEESRRVCEDMEREWTQISEVIRIQEAEAAAKAAAARELEEVADMTEGTTAPGSEGVLTPAEGEFEQVTTLGAAAALGKGKRGRRRTVEVAAAQEVGGRGMKRKKAAAAGSVGRAKKVKVEQA
ncbi:hypothetical protein P167DRAFT_529339 [Morchella conica CCBAS932]|uniref:ISWI chromatin-remodeling complex ATPase ISW2 n=1 Tax=Morchella conica CCBAS932 TaxID=1392247 RepID=A0A3N4KBL8_9PEZI|nr:hypothetical protein P167DRAFT_529339 [Morchella conica CCBAS932]